jgi:SlyX protein
MATPVGLDPVTAAVRHGGGQVKDIEKRIVDLEVRLTHQEAALEELVRARLDQQRAIDAMAARLERLTTLLRQLAPGAADAPADDRPPHY